MVGYINKIKPFSSVDGPGNRTAIFLQGCNFNCIYCHNPETINICSNCGLCKAKCPTKAIDIIEGLVIWNKDKCCNCDECIKTCQNSSSPKIQRLTADEVINEILNYRPFIQGITVSGGECTLQENFIIELFTKAKDIGLTCFIDSNGSKNFSEMKELLELCDGVMLDVKCFENNEHKKYINFNNSNVLNNLEFLASINKLYEVRTVVVPEIFNNEETVREVSKVICKYNSNIRYKIISFRKYGVRKEFSHLKSPESEYIQELKDISKQMGCNNIIIV